MSETNSASSQQQQVGITLGPDGLSINGMPFTPTRPQNNKAGALFDILSVVGAGATTAIALSQLIKSCKKR